MKQDSHKKDLDEKSTSTSFFGVRIPTVMHKRLYRAKAAVEMKSGKFYGMGKLAERVIGRGLSQLERELGIQQDPICETENSENIVGESEQEGD